MKYIFELSILTDGDISFSYVPVNMTRNGDYYLLDREYDSREDALKDIRAVCNFLKGNLETADNNKKQKFIFGIDTFLQKIDTIQDVIGQQKTVHMHIADSELEVSLRTKIHRINIDLFLNDDEYELYRKNAMNICVGDIKKAVMALFEEKSAKGESNEMSSL